MSYFFTRFIASQIEKKINNSLIRKLFGATTSPSQFLKRAFDIKFNTFCEGLLAHSQTSQLISNLQRHHLMLS